MQFNEKSYELHAKHYEVAPELTFEMASNESTVDYWRHARMLNTLLPILGTDKGASWLTVGDGRYGTDAHFINKNGGRALATDISDHFLKVAHSQGHITDYKVENAEKLSFADNSFDYVLCKEAYHHFPRPAIALYEMIRVARKGIILIEPQDANTLIPYRLTVPGSLFWFVQSIKNAVKKIVDRIPYYSYGNYEAVGNYVYTISERELEKVALGLNLEATAFLGINDHYIEGVEFEEMGTNGPLFKKIHKAISRADAACKSGIAPYGILAAFIFSDMPSETTIQAFEKAGCNMNKLMKNPYVH